MTHRTIARREALKLAASSGLLMAGFGRRAWASSSSSEYPFSLGVASGDPWPDGFVLWTRLAPAPLEPHGGMPMRVVAVDWEVAEDERFTRIVKSGVAEARPELGHSVHVEAKGLKPGWRYWYRFRANGEMSPIGTARTATPAGVAVDRLRIGVAGCQHYEEGFYTAYRRLGEVSDLDAIFHYGDYIYEGRPRDCTKVKNCVRSHVGDEIYSLDDYRRRYAQYKLDPDLQFAHAAAPFLASYDDHEVDNNWFGECDQDGSPVEAFLLRRAAAMQAWYEHMPVRRAQLPGPSGITSYRRLDYGRLMRMHVLDTRSHRSDQPCNDGKVQPCPLEAHVSPTMLGTTQENWLDEGLGNDAVWNLIAQQVQVMPYTRHRLGESATYTSYDTWDGYRPARARLINSIRRHNLTNVVVASGDFHRNFVGTVPEREEAPDGSQAAVEFLATSISSNGNGGLLPEAERDLAANPHMKMMDNVRGYHVFEVSPKQWTTQIRAVDQVEAPGGTVRTAATYVATPDRSEVHRA